MLCPDPRLVSAIHKMRQDEVSRMAEHARLMQGIESVRFNFLCRALAGVGGLLISVGQRLQRRYMPVVSCAAETCQPYQLAR